ncbi:hypothetical protein FHG87_016827 [Trinorchestia longiramus]|nr:hypothetical protein FHG87_016827 [Trinorchestia longiramus]
MKRQLCAIKSLRTPKCHPQSCWKFRSGLNGIFGSQILFAIRCKALSCYFLWWCLAGVASVMFVTIYIRR